MTRFEKIANTPESLAEFLVRSGTDTVEMCPICACGSYAECYGKDVTCIQGIAAWLKQEGQGNDKL